MTNRLLEFAALLLLAVLLTACTSREIIDLPVVEDYELDVVAARKELKVGVVPGPYGDMFLEAIYPFLQEMGYTAELVYYDDYTLPNRSLAENHIDLNIFQHYNFLVNNKLTYDLSLSAIAEIPTVSMGIYSTRHTSFNNLPLFASVILPNDSSNLARALMTLESAGLITLDPSIDKTKAALNSIISNPLNLTLLPLQAHTLVQSLSSCHLAVINGNFAVSGGLNPSDALYNELLSADYFNVIAVRTEDLGEVFVQDIIKILRSDGYRAIITDPDSLYSAYQRPLNFFDSMES